MKKDLLLPMKNINPPVLFNFVSAMGNFNKYLPAFRPKNYIFPMYQNRLAHLSVLKVIF